MSNLYKIVHWFYPDKFAAKEGFGIVVDPKQCGCAWDSLIIGFMNWKSTHYQIDQEFGEYKSFRDFNELDYTKAWHYEDDPSEEVVDGIRYSIYLRHKQGLLDNLSLIEILDKLNEHNRTIS